MTKLALFIAGPLDQARIDVGNKQSFVCTKHTFSDSDIVFTPQKITYIPRLICGTELWAPDTMQTPQIIQLLIERYFSMEPNRSQQWHLG